MRVIFLFAFLVLVSSFGCREADLNSPFNAGDMPENSPVIVSASGSYTFNVNANNFSLERNDPLVFQNDSTVITLAIEKHQTGSFNLLIKNSNGDSLFTENSTGNRTLVLLKKFDSFPANANISIKSMTAKVSLVLAVKK